MIIPTHPPHLITKIALVLLLGTIYLLTLAPSLSWANNGSDGGDLISATITGGVAHPSGYPLYLLTAWLAQKIPLGTLAYRTNLLSAVFAMLAALVVQETTYRLTTRKLLAFFSALALGLAPAVWGQAVITEVYTLHLLLCTLILYQAIFPTNHKAADLLRGLVFGLGMAHHVTTIFLLPALAFTPQNDNEKAPAFELRPFIIRLAVAGITAMLFYGTLILRAHNHPPVNWGNPQNISALVWLVSGKLYGGYLMGQDAGFQRVRELLGDLSLQFGFAGLALGIFSLALAPEPRRGLRLLTIYLLAALGAFVLIYATGDGLIYMIPGYALLAVWIGIGLASLPIRWKQIPLRNLALILATLVILWNAIHQYPQVDASRDDRAETFIRHVVENAPPDVMLVTNEDVDTFSLWYAQFGLGLRPDVSIVVSSLLEYDWYRQMLRDAYPALNVPEPAGADRAEAYLALLQANPQRRACLVFAEPQPQVACPNK